MARLELVHRLADFNYFYATSMDPQGGWTDPADVVDGTGQNIVSLFSPGIAVFNESLYLVYRGIGHDDDLRLAWRNAGQGPWEGNIKISSMPGGIAPKSNFNSNPNLAVFRSNLWMAYRDSNDFLFLARFDGNAWYQQPIEVNRLLAKSSHNPGICAYKDRLHIIYRAWRGYVLYHASFDGKDWIGNVPILVRGVQLQSTCSPRFCVFKDILYTVYKAWNSNILYMAYFDGAAWYGDQPISIGGAHPGSDASPGMAAFNDRLYLVYRWGGSDLLAWASFDGSTWSGNALIVREPRPQSNDGPNVCAVPPVFIERSAWMSLLDGSTQIEDINLPGTHDSAAINTLTRTPWATQDHSISDQLQLGVRLLDVRLKVKKDGNEFKFVTCHGSIGSSIGLNEYQSLDSLMKECENFLKVNSREALIMLLQIDDWTDASQAQALGALGRLLEPYPISVNRRSLPKLSDIRGKILLINRISGHLDRTDLGTPFPWVGNTPGALIKRSTLRDYPFWLQDQYESLARPEEETKLNLVTGSFQQHASGRPVLNFASATKPAFGVSWNIAGVYINDRLLSFFGAVDGAQRPHFGWLFLDDAFKEFQTDKYGEIDLVDVIVDSNFGYSRFPGLFRVVGS